jgi:release factor glutamine methyltransferase
MNYQNIKTKLASAGIETADLEARILLEDIAGIPKSEFFFQRDKQLSDDISNSINTIIDRRVQGESLGRILGYRDFWKSRFYLSADTLEPRPDTETLIEEVLRDGQSPKRILDLGTGTGCILLSLLQEFPDATGVAVDKAYGACVTAGENAKRLALENRTTILNGSWFDPIPKDSKFDLIVSNPPYIPSQEIRNLQSEVKNHDPILALDGGDDGLLPYKYLCSNLKRYLEPHGIVVLEFGVGQAFDITRIVEEAGATLIRVTNDLGGVPRVIKFTYGDN